MSHEIETVNGQAAMAWTNQVPWHGLGTEMDPNATPLEWMQVSQLAWKVLRQPMKVEMPDGSLQSAGDYAVLVRDTDNKIFGPCGPKFIPTSNYAVFEWLKKFTDAGNMKMETCGSLKGGTEIWALARFADDFDIVPGDTLKGYLLFHVSHIWGKGNQIRLTPIRVVCNNTLTMSLRSAHSGKYSMSHLTDFDINVQENAELALGLADTQLKEFKESAEFLSSKRAKHEDVVDFFAELYQPKLKETADSSQPLETFFTPTAKRAMDSLTFAPGATLQGSKGTWWGALNAVTYAEDHLRRSNGDASNALASSFIGSGSNLKSKALNLALDYAKAA